MHESVALLIWYYLLGNARSDAPILIARLEVNCRGPLL